MKTYWTILGVVAVVIIGVLWTAHLRIAQAPSPQMCTMEAKICPDGSSVGRMGPNCEFAACPTPQVIATTTPSTGTGIAIGSSATINGVSIKVLSLVEDSRCPVDVQCIQAGTVRVSASVNTSASLIFKLDQSQVVGDKTITLTSVIPAQKNSKQTVQLSDYRFIFTVASKTPVSSGGGTICTMDAKQCSDGSYVSRTGPNCQFAACPSGTSGVRGTVVVGPTCPVMQDPPTPQCNDKPYATSVSVYRDGSAVPLLIGNSNASGAFEFSLPSGQYTLTANGGATLPRCSSVNVTIPLGGYATTTISCDSGIR